MTNPIEDEFVRRLFDHFASDPEACVRGSMLLQDGRVLELDDKLDNEVIELILDSTPLLVEVYLGAELVLSAFDGWTGISVLMEPEVAEGFVSAADDG